MPNYDFDYAIPIKLDIRPGEHTEDKWKWEGVVHIGGIPIGVSSHLTVSKEIFFADSERDKMLKHEAARELGKALAQLIAGLPQETRE